MYTLYVGIDEQDIDNNLDFVVLNKKEKQKIESDHESIYDFLDETYKSFQKLKVTDNNIRKLEELLKTIKEIRSGKYGG